MQHLVAATVHNAVARKARGGGAMSQVSRSKFAWDLIQRNLLVGHENLSGSTLSRLSKAIDLVGDHTAGWTYHGKGNVTLDMLPYERLRGPFFVEKKQRSAPQMARLKMEVSKYGVLSFFNGEMIDRSDVPIRSGGQINFGRYTNRKLSGNFDSMSSYTIHSLRVRKH